MAYVDHAFSITDEDDLVGGAIGGPRGAPVKEIAFAAALLAFGVLGVVAGLFMAANQVGGDTAHGETESPFTVLVTASRTLKLLQFSNYCCMNIWG
uniref:Predicted protein n=1 Tax=Hordeum vulgare subsp. vulgare TaxID=112509 RepID=F2DUW4_HORVV|nr:predicted protein [Hordeum vulgare subsp. vulgare]